MTDLTSGTWSRMAGWRIVLPPSRPDTVDLLRIIQHARGIDRSAPVAVLGSTPEFRDVLHDLGFSDIYVLEKHLPHLTAVSAERIYSNREHIVEGDWLHTLPTHRSHFSLLLSDLTSGNIAWASRRAFYESVADALASGGVFIDKVLTNERSLLTLDEIAAKYAWSPPNLQVLNYFSCEALFCSVLQLEHELVDTSRLYDQLSEAMRAPRLEAIIAGAQSITPRDCVWYYGKPWRKLERDYCPRLNLLAKYDLTESQPYHGRGAQYVWRRT